MKMFPLRNSVKPVGMQELKTFVWKYWRFACQWHARKISCSPNDMSSAGHPLDSCISFDELNRSSVTHTNLRRNSDYQFPSVRQREVIECTKRTFRKKTLIHRHEHLLRLSAWAVAVLASDIALFKSNYLYFRISRFLYTCGGKPHSALVPFVFKQ